MLQYVAARGKTYTNGFPYFEGNSVHHPFIIRSEKNLHPCERLVLFVEKKFASVLTACVARQGFLVMTVNPVVNSGMARHS